MSEYEPTEEELLARPKGMRRKDWASILHMRKIASLPQHFIVWSHRGFPIQWARGPDWNEGTMKEIEDDFPMRGGLPLELWHVAIVDAMHWSYEPLNEPPPGWRRATSEDMANMVIDPDELDSNASVH
jgi:hypothetical protein